MRGADLALALAAVVIWGLSFVAIKTGVEAAPPFLLTALRFGFAAFPLVLFVKPPAAPRGAVALYGALIGIFQFGLLFAGVRLGMPVGLASLVMQLQAFFTMALAAALYGERPTRAQTWGALVAASGMALIGYVRWRHAGLLPFALTLAASFCWGAGNVAGKTAGRVEPFGFVAWSSLVVPLPMLALSALTSPAETYAALAHPSLKLALSVAFLSYAGSVGAFGLWVRLLSRYPAPVVSPFSLLVPVVGMTAAGVAFGEWPSAGEALGALVVIAGLSINVFGGRMRKWFNQTSNV